MDDCEARPRPSRHGYVSSAHTGTDDCPECKRIDAEQDLAPNEVDEMVDVLMVQFDEMVTKLSDRVRSRGLAYLGKLKGKI